MGEKPPETKKEYYQQKNKKQFIKDHTKKIHQEQQKLAQVSSGGTMTPSKEGVLDGGDHHWRDKVTSMRGSIKRSKSTMRERGSRVFGR